MPLSSAWESIDMTATSSGNGPVHARFDGPIVMVGFGSIGKGTLPLIERHIAFDRAKFVVIAPDDDDRRLLDDRQIRFIHQAVTKENYRDLLTPLLTGGPGRGMMVNLSVETSSVDLIAFCKDIDVFYIDTVVEPWPGLYTDRTRSVAARSNYALRESVLDLRRRRPGGITAVSCCGANPGMVSWMVKQALIGVARDLGITGDAPKAREGWARLMQRVGVKGVHIAERDTQRARDPKPRGVFVNTWSIEGFYEEGTAPAELGWGTHERRLPKYAHTPIGGPGNQIFLAQPGMRTFVHSWVPAGGPIIGMVVRHAESFTISDHLTVWDDTIEGRRAVYRPTVHYAYMPCDNGLLSLHELAMRNYQLQPTLRIMSEEIVDGMDELGVLLMGHGLTTWWTGSQLDIHEARRLVQGQNATTLQVAAGVLAGLVFMIDNPRKGILVPDELPFREILDVAGSYLGPCPSVRTSWTPLESRSRLFGKWGAPPVDDSDLWQFASFAVEP